MRRRRLAALLAVMVLGATSVLGGCSGASESDSATGSKLPFANTTKGVSADAGGWKSVFSDDFDGTSLDRGKWRTREQPAFGRRLCATPDAGMVRVRNGRAVLGIARSGKATKTCPHGVFKNAMIGTGEVTKPGFAATYGLFAARVKFQSGRGQHGAFWLQGTGAGSAEIDTAEYYGDGKKDGGFTTLVHATATDGTVTSVGGPVPKVAKVLGKGNTPANGWHVWSVEWSPKGYVFRLDDTVTLRTKRNLASSPEFMVLSLLTSDWELSALNTTRSTMDVDWVRVWQR